MPLLPGVLLRDLQFHRRIRMLQTAKERRNRFAYLKIDWPRFDLNDYVVVELAVERMEYIVCGSSAVTLGILPVEVMVVDKRPVKKNAAVRSKRACNHIGGICRRPAVSGRSGPALGVRFDNKPAEVRNAAIDAVYFFPPPL